MSEEELYEKVLEIVTRNFEKEVINIRGMVHDLMEVIRNEECS